MNICPTILSALILLAPAAIGQDASSAQNEGVSAQSLAKLDQLIQTLVNDDDIVGGELLVIKNGHSILHEAYGMRDRENGIAMETGTVFCVRSMTKPFIGASIMMLVEEGLLKLDEPIAKYIAAFDADSTRAITIQQLLTHTSGLSMSQIMSADLYALDGIQEVANMAGGLALEFEPGTDFNYSDQGTDTLTALIEIVSGVSAAEFVETRLLSPLGMNESACVMSEDHPLRERGSSKYAGVRGSWTKFWSPDQRALFPFFLGSQGLYSTLEDYARFTNFWLQNGNVDGKQLLSKQSISQVLTPSPYGLGASTAFSGLQVDYGSLMQLWTKESSDPEKDSTREVVVFGHTGSDGTHAWVFPEQNAMVFYFTQSRGTHSGLRVEQVLGEMFLGQDAVQELTAPPLDPYLGYYWEHDDDSYRAIIRDGEDLALEVPGKAIIPLVYAGEDSWTLRPNPAAVLEFTRAENGEVSGYTLGGKSEYRFTPSAELVDGNVLATLIAKTHRLDLIEELGPIQIVSHLEFLKLGMEGEIKTTLAWPNKYLFNALIGTEFENVAFDGEQVMYEARNNPAAVVEGDRATQMRLGQHWARFGDWHQWHAQLIPIQRLERAGKQLLLLRAGNTSGPAPTLFIDLETGQVLGEDSMVTMDGLGRVGQRIRFRDFRDVSGMLLPYETKIQYAQPMIGSAVSKVVEINIGVELSDGAFELLK
ncbi:MAG: CubicO group peptidase (beta-lactamase class C family) [Myxococcota bacterium]|jgi:CubicO group peptidase (beta-lactamase class C family)